MVIKFSDGKSFNFEYDGMSYYCKELNVYIGDKYIKYFIDYPIKDIEHFSRKIMLVNTHQANIISRKAWRNDFIDLTK